jgi:hypothetical protein
MCFRPADGKFLSSDAKNIHFDPFVLEAVTMQAKAF